MQMASSPMRSASESPSGIGSAPSGAGLEKWSTAMSVPSSWPTSVASITSPLSHSML